MLLKTGHCCRRRGGAEVARIPTPACMRGYQHLFVCSGLDDTLLPSGPGALTYVLPTILTITALGFGDGTQPYMSGFSCWSGRPSICDHVKPLICRKRSIVHLDLWQIEIVPSLHDQAGCQCDPRHVSPENTLHTFKEFASTPMLCVSKAVRPRACAIFLESHTFVQFTKSRAIARQSTDTNQPTYRQRCSIRALTDTVPQATKGAGGCAQAQLFIRLMHCTLPFARLLVHAWISCELVLV